MGGGRVVVLGDQMREWEESRLESRWEQGEREEERERDDGCGGDEGEGVVSGLKNEW